MWDRTCWVVHEGYLESSDWGTDDIRRSSGFTVCVALYGPLVADEGRFQEPDV